MLLVSPAAPTVQFGSSPEVEVADGDDSTLTCTAAGYPEVTISFQISGLSASYTEGNQSTVTIATPTVPFNVSRSITVSNVTIADCDAVITCTAENTHRDGIQNTSGSVTIQVLGKKWRQVLNVMLTARNILFF